MLGRTKGNVVAGQSRNQTYYLKYEDEGGRNHRVYQLVNQAPMLPEQL